MFFLAVMLISNLHLPTTAMILADTNSVDVFHTGKSWKKCRSYSGRRRGTEHLGFPLLGVIMMMLVIMMINEKGVSLDS